MSKRQIENFMYLLLANLNTYLTIMSKMIKVTSAVVQINDEIKSLKLKLNPENKPINLRNIFRSTIIIFDIYFIAVVCAWPKMQTRFYSI